MTGENRNGEDRLNEGMENGSGEDRLNGKPEERTADESRKEDPGSELERLLREENVLEAKREIQAGPGEDEPLPGAEGVLREPEEYFEPEEESGEDMETAPGDPVDFSDEFGTDGKEDYGELPGMAGQGTRKKIFTKKRVIIGVILLLCAAIVGMVPFYLKYKEKVAFYEEHFFAGTYINGVDFSDCTPEEAERTLLDQIDVYKLTIQTREGDKIILNGSDINLEAKFDVDFQALLGQQNPKEWYKLREETFEYDTDTLWSYDEALLKKWFESQKYFDESTKVETVKSEIVTEEGFFKVTEAVQGTRMNMKLTYQELEKAVKGLKPELKLTDIKCYLDPIIDLDASDLEETAEKLNTYLRAEITYDMKEGITEIVNADIIRSCLSLDDKNEIVFDTTPLSDFVTNLQNKYDTYGSSRPFLTHYGSVITVYGGSYGWKLNWQATFDDLVAHVQAGEPAVLEPIYDQSAASHGTYDYGGTYAEVDMNSQTVYYYVNGQLTHTAACVTGKPSDPTRDLTTPTGTYQIVELLSPKTMRGYRPDGSLEYETPCKYWMRVTWTGIGFHDATWQPYFGGDRYLLDGSHGCINLSYSDARYFYGQFYIGMPVIMYGGVKRYNAPVSAEPEPPEPSTEAPTTAPTQTPTTAPTQAPTTAPTQAPTTAPTQAPTTAPTEAPTTAPTEPSVPDTSTADPGNASA
ncbi:MAG: L,D-transpeptidase family protein [Lachnospiraceae bacterium]|nr:L,D-transpeptidase family protein [Lachnospiraceae bacterium]